MDWFLYDNGLRYERVNSAMWITVNRVFESKVFKNVLRLLSHCHGRYNITASQFSMLGYIYIYVRVYYFKPYNAFLKMVRRTLNCCKIV